MFWAGASTHPFRGSPASLAACGLAPLLFCPYKKTVFILGTGTGGWIGAVNSILPLFLGMFTAWFQKRYPTRAARG